jgi:hypothetical protein
MRTLTVSAVVNCVSCGTELTIGPVFQFSGAFACGACILAYMRSASPFPERVRLEEWGHAFSLEEATSVARSRRSRRRYGDDENGDF